MKNIEYSIFFILRPCPGVAILHLETATGGGAPSAVFSPVRRAGNSASAFVAGPLRRVSTADAPEEPSTSTRVGDLLADQVSQLAHAVEPTQQQCGGGAIASSMAEPHEPITRAGQDEEQPCRAAHGLTGGNAGDGSSRWRRGGSSPGDGSDEADPSARDEAPAVAGSAARGGQVQPLSQP